MAYVPPYLTGIARAYDGWPVTASDEMKMKLQELLLEVLEDGPKSIGEISEITSDLFSSETFNWRYAMIHRTLIEIEAMPLWQLRPEIERVRG